MSARGGLGSVPRQIRGVGIAPIILLPSKNALFPSYMYGWSSGPRPYTLSRSNAGVEEIGQSVRIVLHLQAARWVEGNVMIDELPQVRIERGDATSRTGAVESIA